MHTREDREIKLLVKHLAVRHLNFNNLNIIHVYNSINQIYCKNSKTVLNVSCVFEKNRNRVSAV